MKKWAVISADKKGMDEWVKSYASKEEAIEGAKKDWSYLTPAEKSKRTVTVGLVNLDPNDNFFEDDNGIVDGDIYEIAVQFGGE